MESVALYTQVFALLTECENIETEMLFATGDEHLFLSWQRMRFQLELSRLFAYASPTMIKSWALEMLRVQSEAAVSEQGLSSDEVSDIVAGGYGKRLLERMLELQRVMAYNWHHRN